MPPTSNKPVPGHNPKKDRACDACRRRKTKCDGASMHNHVCTNCIQTRKPCTYLEASKPRGPPKAYITSLEDRLEALEAILQQLRPDQDFSDELGPPVVRGSWKTQGGALTVSSAAVRMKSPIVNNILPPLLIPYRTGKIEESTQSAMPTNSDAPRSTHLVFQSKLPSKRMRMRVNMATDFSSSSDESSDSSCSSSEQVEETVITSLDGREKIVLFASENDDTPEENPIRFHGRSSTAGLIETTRQFKHMHIRDAVNLPDAIPDEKATTVIPDNLTVAQWRRPAFWKTPTWEYSHEAQRAESLDRLQALLQYFPEQSLATNLIGLYFRHSNLIFPLLHRPTFSRQWKEQLHHRNIWFAGVCLLIFAIGSRWCRDERMLPQPSPGERPAPDWTKAGQRYYEVAIEIYLIRQSFLHPISLFEVQTLTLMGIYLSTTNTFPTAWLYTSVGLRKVQDVGAHRKKVYRSKPSIDDELWKRAFWLLVVLDRIGGVNLGRACGISEEDFDLDLPLEVDDEFWDTKSQNFHQPPGSSSTITAFIQLIKLSQIMAFTMRTLYAIDKPEVYQGSIPLDKKSLTKQTSLAMTEWLEHLPEHLRWHNVMPNPIFRIQSACLMSFYQLTQTLIWRPLLRKAPYDSECHPLSIPLDPAMIHCTEAARECVHIVEAQLNHGIESFYVPATITISYVCGGLLLLNAWNQKMRAKLYAQNKASDMESPLTGHIEQDVTKIKTFIRALEKIKGTWEIADMLLMELKYILDGLTSQPSADDFTMKKFYSQSSPLDLQINIQPRSGPQEQSYFSRTPLIENSHGWTQHKKSLVGLSHPFPEVDPGARLAAPGNNIQLETRRSSDLKSRRLSISTAPIGDEHTSTLINTASWHGGVPFISSMRHTSTSNLHTLRALNPPENGDLPSDKPTMSVLESAVRYDDVILRPGDRPRRVGIAQHADEHGSQQYAEYR